MTSAGYLAVGFASCCQDVDLGLANGGWLPPAQLSIPLVLVEMAGFQQSP